jgi:hypothetical protein
VAPLVVVEIDPSGDAAFEQDEVVVLADVDVLVLEAPPESLDHDIVDPSPAAVHADTYAVALGQIDPGAAGELTALVRVQDLWPGSRRLRGVLKSIQAEARIQGVRKTPAEDRPAWCAPQFPRTPAKGRQPDLG